MAQREGSSASPSGPGQEAAGIAALFGSLAAVFAAPLQPATSGSITELVTRLTALLADGLGGSVVLLLARPDGRLALAASVDSDPLRDDALRRGLGLSPVSARAGLLSRVLVSGEPVEAPAAAWGQIAQWGDPAAVEVLEGLGPLAVCMVPVRARGSALGALLWARPAGSPSPGGLERALLQEVADRVGLAGAYESQMAATLSAETRLRSSAARQVALADLGAGRSSGSPTPTSSRTPSACSPISSESTSCTCSRP